MKIVVTSAGTLRKILEWLRVSPVPFPTYTLTVTETNAVTHVGTLQVAGAVAGSVSALALAPGTGVTAGACTIAMPDKLRLTLQKVGERPVTVESFADHVEVSWVDATYPDAPEESIVTLDGGTL